MIEKLQQELKAAKEENETLRKEIVERNQQLFKAKDEIKIQTNLAKVNNDVVINLTQQNKQMRENINNIKNLCNEDWEDMTVDKFQNQLLQSLKEVNNEK